VIPAELDDARVPDLAGEVVGWKALRLFTRDKAAETTSLVPVFFFGRSRDEVLAEMDPGQRLALCSPRNTTLWPTDGWLVASCDAPTPIVGYQPEYASVRPLLQLDATGKVSELKNMALVPHTEAAALAPPWEQCMCGIYAVEDVYQALPYTNGGDGLVVRVAGAGKVIPGTQGWRAERARITGVLDGRPLAAEVARVYGVDVLAPDGNPTPQPKRDRVRIFFRSSRRVP
jgi:hypothetical protein